MCRDMEVAAMKELEIVLSIIVATLRLIQVTPGIMKQFASSDFRWELENTKADITMKMRGNIIPVIIERLDDGTDPTHQHLSLDIAPAFSQGRIERALYYSNGLTRDAAFKIIGYEWAKQAMRGAEHGEELTISTTIDMLDGAVIFTFVLTGHVGQDYTIVSQKLDKSIFRIFRQFPKRVKEQKELRKAEKAKLDDENVKKIDAPS